MKRVYLLPLFFLYTAVCGQAIYPRWNVGVNPLSVIESMPSIGPCVSYRFSQKLEAWGETSVIFGNLYAKSLGTNVSGYRFIVQPRFYPGKKHLFFIAVEFRLKQYSYNSSGTFINHSTNATLQNFPYKASQVLPGWAFVFGKQMIMSQNHHLYLDLTVGFGSKQRNITIKNKPAGYEYNYVSPRSYVPQYGANNTESVYFPVGVRLMWRLNN